MKNTKSFKIMLIMFVLATTLAYAKDVASEDILITVKNPDYKVSKVKILRIASDNSPKVLCQKLHWMLEFYYAPREWDIYLNVDETGEGTYETTVKGNSFQNNMCGSSLITELNITVHDTVQEKDFNFGSYLYTDGNETILLRATVSYNQGDWESEATHKVKVEVIDRYVSENDSTIEVEIIDSPEEE